jgi:hypothetical protein
MNHNCLLSGPSRTRMKNKIRPNKNEPTMKKEKTQDL